jgi:hypothetical protein
MSLCQLIYVSTLRDKDESLLPGILQSAVRNNQLHGVTGMLLYHEGSLLQVLEGATQDVNETYRKIESDPRHHDLFLLDDFQVMTRDFANWSMGFSRISSEDLRKFPQYDLFFKYSRSELMARAGPGIARQIIETFGVATMRKI